MNSKLYNNFQNKFITLVDLQLPQLPERLEIESDVYVRKSEFHITLFAVERTAKLINEAKSEDIKIQLVQDFYDFVGGFNLDRWELTGETRLVNVEGNKTLVAMAKLKGIDKFFEKLSEKYGKKLPVQPTHITLYTLPTDTFGIPINSYEELENISKPFSIPEVQDKLAEALS